MMFASQPTVPHSSFPSVDSMSTRVFAPVPVPAPILEFLGRLAVETNDTGTTTGVNTYEPAEYGMLAARNQSGISQWPQFDALGTISNGTRHQVLEQNEQGWLRIQVSQWTALETDAPLDARQGWINGNQEYVRVVSRRWW